MRGMVAANDVCPVIGRIGRTPHESFLRRARYDAFNVGMALGGRGPRSLVPLLAVWLTAAWALGRAARRETSEPGAEGEPALEPGGLVTPPHLDEDRRSR
jgi:hypothetical protein